MGTPERRKADGASWSPIESPIDRRQDEQGSNTIGQYNTAMGSGTLAANTSGGDNTAMGTYALGGNTTGNVNVAIGWFAGARASRGRVKAPSPRTAYHRRT
jgi:hypothetical protein